MIIPTPPSIGSILLRTVSEKLIGNITKSAVDNVIKKNVHPRIGSIVHCELGLNIADHTGVYIGKNKIVHLDGSGAIESVTPKTFLKRLGGFNSAMSIYVSCDEDGDPVGSDTIAKRAKKMVGKNRDYNLILDNCHQFTSGCITGDFENSDNFFWMIEHTAKEHLRTKKWRVWETIDGEYT